jgi:transaldolase
MKIKLFADTASIDEMRSLAGTVHGFTTNPTLMRRAGVVDYAAFAKAVLAAVPTLPVSFEVLADDLLGMIREGRVIGSWAPNVYVKVPIVTTAGHCTVGVVDTLLRAGIKVNLTAVVDIDAIAPFVGVFASVNMPVIVSVFAGRIADTGRNASYHTWMIRDILKGLPHVEVLWASTREARNIVEAEESHCQIITVTPDILRKVAGFNRPLADITLATVKQFHDDAVAAGYTL